MKKLTASLLMVTALCLLSTTAFAATEDSTPTFEALDADRNGFISTDEAASCESLLIDFGKIDVNQDGKLDPEEYAVFDQKAVQKS
ncbi:hypothetical protein Pcar_1742 [Syntrophotalea carbinolica DSM 2380]|uniref:EF-hand domain-containing protein n=1 Tax=Syntrophotalea carbinolica (strain DSM 2380 / NBRC 103641 / GraBd1) TaxID=338963 RepID=Q3A3S2_SYNC1|nr:hypothetical protein [Syntrophotalea carbinolica]ABA88985.1 hypothetical protein Pcar_1742 [Syntrophotalea carbinolica DSM 2380]